MYPGVPRVDVHMQADWHEKHILLKVAFPVSARSDKATFEIPYGSVERPTTRNTPAEQAQFEVPALRWADISDATHGFSLLNDSKYGYDAKDNVLRLSLLRSPDLARSRADQGHHEFTYSLYPHARHLARGDDRAPGLRAELSADDARRPRSIRARCRRRSRSSPRTEDNVVITAIKKAADDDALIVRFYEWAGKKGDVHLQLAASRDSRRGRRT